MAIVWVPPLVADGNLYAPWRSLGLYPLAYVVVASGVAPSFLVTTSAWQCATSGWPVSGHTFLWLCPFAALSLGTPLGSADAVVATAAGTRVAANSSTMSFRARSTCGVPFRGGWGPRSLYVCDRDAQG